MSKIILVTGHPGTGKTTLSHKIARQFTLPCLNKDVIKEAIGDVIEVHSRVESKKIGKASHQVLDRMIDMFLVANTDFIVEANFPAEFYDPKFTAWSNTYNFSLFQIVCIASPQVLFDRVVKRVNTSARHPVHAELEDIDSGKYRENLQDGKITPIKTPGETYILDTTNFANINYEDIFTKLTNFLS